MAVRNCRRGGKDGGKTEEGRMTALRVGEKNGGRKSSKVREGRRYDFKRG